MKHYIFLVGTSLLTANVPAKEEFVMPRMQQNTYLSHAKPVEKFGLRVIPDGDKFSIKNSIRFQQSQTIELGFTKGPIPVIPVGLKPDETKMNALLDTSSSISWMEFGVAQKFGAIFLESKNEPLKYAGTYNTGDAPGYAAVAPELYLNTLELENTPLFIRMALNSMGPLARGIEVPQVDSVFGYDLLKNFEFIRFDFRNENVIFSTKDAFIPNKELLMTSASIVEVPGFGLAVEGSVIGTPTPIILDVAGNYAFSRGDIKKKITKQVSLGEVVYRKVPTLLLPTYEGPPRAGRKMLEKYSITICPKAGIVHFERYPE